MTREEAIVVLQKIRPIPHRGDGWSTTHALETLALDIAINALQQEPCEDAISRQAVLEIVERVQSKGDALFEIEQLSSVTAQPKTKHCKDCKYFEYDSVAKVDGVPLIVAHEICSRWGNGCKTRDDGYCYFFEPQAESKGKTCEGCINAKECVMFDPNMKRCKEYKEDQKEIYNKGFSDGQKALAEHLKLCKEELLDKMRAEILEEKECAYADFERYKVEYLGQGCQEAYDSEPYDDFRYGMERCIEIIDEYRRSEKE